MATAVAVIGAHGEAMCMEAAITEMTAAPHPIRATRSALFTARCRAPKSLTTSCVGANVAGFDIARG